MELDTLVDLFNNEEKIFAIYRLPGSDHQQLILQHNHTIHTLDPEELFTHQAGFAITAFGNNPSVPNILISADELEKIKFDEAPAHGHKDYLSELLSDKSAHHDHIKLITKAISDINSANINKVVLSRKVEWQVGEDFDILNQFLQLSQTYPNNFCYYFQVPGIGKWMGASPELLLNYQNNQLHTSSLAGTINKKDRSSSWRDKEKEEQDIVSVHIEKSLNECGFEKYSIQGPIEIKMGNIAHLLTNYKADVNDKKQLSTFLNILHPTPAICGSPKNLAMDYILLNEQHDRKYYTGYLGPVNIEYNTSLFVNLRCMELEKSKINLYVGGGITSSSNPEEEWIETCLKGNTLLF